MPIPKADLFRVRYDWDRGVWLVEVLIPDEDLFWRSFREEEDAEKAKADLMNQLAHAPSGDTKAVLKEWMRQGS